MGKATESTEDHIHTVAAKREEFLSILAATEHAKASLTRAKLNVAALKGPWYDSDALCSDLNARKIDIRKEYEDLRDSHVRKLFGGSKFQEALKEKEEDLAEVEEWYEKADQARVEPQKKLDEAKEVRGNLEKLVEDHLQAQIGLEELYASVFDGPSPANAEEDALELELNKAQDIFDPIQADLSKAATVVNYIALARMRINYAYASVAQALHISQTDIYDHNTSGRIGAIHNFSSATADIQERRQLEWVRRSMAEASQFLAMAHELDPEVRGFVMPKIADGHSLAGRADSWINTPVTDYMFHREIAATGRGVMMAGAIIDEELELADKKVVVLAAKRDAAGKDLKEARKKLHDLRGRIFEAAVNGREGAPVPSYEAAMTTEEAPPYSEGESSRQAA